MEMSENGQKESEKESKAGREWSCILTYKFDWNREVFHACVKHRNLLQMKYC